MPAKAALLNAVAAAAPAGARVLEVDCGLGHLSLRLARHHGFEMTGLDLDPAMMRAQANAKPTPTVRGTATTAGHRCSSATWASWPSPTGRSTWSSAPPVVREPSAARVRATLVQAQAALRLKART
jgi:SAM-dependent methyltransferase